MSVCAFICTCQGPTIIKPESKHIYIYIYVCIIIYL